MATVSGEILEQVRSYYNNVVGSAFLPGTEEWLLLSHYGEITPSKIDNLLKVVESSILESGAKRRIMKRVCSVMIESLQNVSIHGAQDESRSQRAILAVIKTESSFKVVTGNLILAKEAPQLEKKLDELNSYTKSELRKLYIETLCNENFSYKGGAGLGFLTIAKKSEHPIEFDLSPVDSKLSYFTVVITIDNEE